jgi:hypothetical protein
MCASGHAAGTVARARHGYEATREAAMAVFAKTGGGCGRVWASLLTSGGERGDDRLLRRPGLSAWAALFLRGAGWRGHLVRDEGVAGSNPATPTNT